jgi:hypothetical protein
MTIILLRGSSIEMFFRLWTFAPLIASVFFGCGGGAAGAPPRASSARAARLATDAIGPTLLSATEAPADSGFKERFRIGGAPTSGIASVFAALGFRTVEEALDFVDLLLKVAARSLSDYR